MKKFRLLSAFLTVVMVFGMLLSPVSALLDENGEEIVPGIDEETGTPTITYLTQTFRTPEEKLSTMTKYLEQRNFQLYVEPFRARSHTSTLRPARSSSRIPTMFLSHPHRRRSRKSFSPRSRSSTPTTIPSSTRTASPKPAREVRSM